MTWWLRSRRVWAPICAAVVCAVGLDLFNTRIAPLPVVLGSDGFVLWTTFLPLLWAMAVAHCYASKTQSAEVRPSRRTQWLDVLLLVFLTAVAVTVFSLMIGPHESATAAAGHVLVMTGVSCGLTLRGGEGAGVLGASALLIATTFYGTRAPAGAYVRILQPDGAPAWSLLVGLVTCLMAGVLIVSDATTIRFRAGDRLAD